MLSMFSKQSGDGIVAEYNPNNGMISVLESNYGDNVGKEMRKIREILGPSAV